MILLSFLGAILLTSTLPIILYKRNNTLIFINQGLMLTLIVAASCLAFFHYQHAIFSVDLLRFNEITMTLSIQCDVLTKIMMLFILSIGFIIYRYAQNYLESDSTRIRFLSQFNLVLFSVLLLVMSANLLTAFIAWQFIGISLYLLLNHYHNDPAANRAAKKKFVINLIGDCTFLLAIILSYHSSSTTSFASLQSSQYAELICGLLFISVMTKCAQFPFHIWLTDTMETPTPVSALMHAGVINAGGVLLTRISSALVMFQTLSCLILFIALLSACLSIHWMNQQPDTKKKLAYSTMGQMGYMLAQCSLGVFPAAIFHLISHGFYKASLFLNAGETLKTSVKNTENKIHYKNIFWGSFFAIIIFISGISLLKGKMVDIPILMYGFILITLITLTIRAKAFSNQNNIICIINYLCIWVLFVTYLYCFNLFSSIIPEYEYSSKISVASQLIILALLFLVQCYLWVAKKPFNSITIKDNTEKLLRRFLLNPLRSAGNIINTRKGKKFSSSIYKTTLVVMSLCFIYALIYVLPEKNPEHFNLAVFIFLIIAIIALTIANRCLSIKSLIAYLILFEIAFTNIAFFDGNMNITKIGIFHIINISTVLFMLFLLSQKSISKKPINNKDNRLPTRAFYLVFSLLLLIGIPGTASFISEFYMLSTLIHNGALFIVMYLGLIILVAIVIMHSLQLYAFNEISSELLSQPIKKINHFIYSGVITLNIVCGVFPNILLSHIFK